MGKESGKIQVLPAHVNVLEDPDQLNYDHTLNSYYQEYPYSHADKFHDIQGAYVSEHHTNPFYFEESHETSFDAEMGQFIWSRIRSLLQSSRLVIFWR